MNNSDWQKIKEIFNEALEQPTEQRSHFLSEKCGSDAKLRAEVESLLKNHQSDYLEESPTDKILELITDRLEIGQEIEGRYRILRKLGKGGMGEVYLAKDLKLDRLIALKVLNEELSQDKQRLEQFEKEARAAASLDSEHIIRIIEHTEKDGLSFITTEYFEGKNLRQKLQASPLDIETILQIVKQVASALGAAHQKNIVHSDIKPENIMINDKGQVKILDFGIARLIEPDLAELKNNPLLSAQNENTPEGLGTANYMSPEQILKEDIDGRSDIWSLGICLYEMLADKKPFAEKTRFETFAAILYKPQPELLTEDTSMALKNVVEKALQKNRDDRYQTVDEFHSALENVTNSKSKKPEKPHYEMNTFNEWRKNSGKPIWYALFLCVILCFVISLCFAIFTSNLLDSNYSKEELKKAREKFEKNEDPSKEKKDTSIEERETAKTVLSQPDKEPSYTEIINYAKELATPRVAGERRKKDFAKNFMASVGVFHLIILGFAFLYYFKNSGPTGFHDIEKDKEQDGSLKSSITNSTGYEDPSDWKEARDNATDALKNFKSKFLRLLIAWSFFYFIIVLGFITEEKWSDLFKDNEKVIAPLIASLLTLVNNFNTIYLWSCYQILNNPISLESKNSETRKVIINQNNQDQLSLDSFYIVAVIWFLLEFLIPILSPKNGAFLHDTAYLLSGLFGGIAMAVFVGRFQSKFLKSSKVLIVLLYLYTVIQSLFIFIGDDSVKSKMWAALVIQIALFLKCLLILYMFWLLQSGRLLFYLVRVRRADEQIDREWENFPEVLKR